MRIAPRVFWPLIPMMVINLEPVRQEGILHISTNCVLESPFPSFLPKGLPNPSLSPSPFSFTFSPARTHTEHPRWHTHYAMYFCDFSGAPQNFSVAFTLPKNESQAVCWSGKRWQWPLEERSAWQLPVGSGCGGRLSWAERRSVRS